MIFDFLWKILNGVYLAAGKLIKNIWISWFGKTNTKPTNAFVGIASIEGIQTTEIAKNEIKMPGIDIIPEPVIKPAKTQGQPTKTKEQHFIESLHIAVADKFNPLCVYTHCYLETDNFRRLVGEWNFCGCKIPQKAIPPVPIKSIELLTHEVVDGISKKVIDTFTDFNSADDFMIFYIWQIKRLYKMTYENRNNPEMYFCGLTHDINKWATDPSYTDKLEKVYKHLITMGIRERILDNL